MGGGRSLQQSLSASTAHPTSLLCWYLLQHSMETPYLSAQVLADVGDGQSLQQSLSTFSAHVRRLRLILAAATPSSLTLLDEVGSGALSVGACDGVWRQPRSGPWQ